MATAKRRSDVVVNFCLRVLVAITICTSSVGTTADIRQITNPFIIEHPEDQYVARNDPATLNCKAEGRPDPIITWYRNGQPVVTAIDNPSVDRMLLPSGQLFLMKVSPSGKSGRPTDVGVYYCNATNPETGFSVISRNATLDIAVIREEFREQPVDTEVASGHEAVIRCRPPRAEPEARVRWKKDDIPLRTNTDRVFVDETGSLHILDSRRDDAGIYACVASNVAGERVSETAKLVIREKPRIIESPKDIVAKEHSNVIFHCRATGDPEPTIIWKKVDGQIAAERSFIMPDRMLQIERVQLSDEGVYVCRVENSVGWREAEAKLTVHSPPSFVVTPGDKSTGVGRQIVFRCEVTGNPTPAVFWNRESSETFMFPNQDHGRLSVLDDGSLVISSVRTEDAGIYMCQGLSMAGTAIAKVKLDVKDIDTRLPPIIIHGPQNQTLPLGGVATLMCAASGDPQPDIHWFRNGRVLTSIGRDPRFASVDAGTLLISELRRTDAGSYVCRASSETGTTTSSVAILTVDSPSSAAIVFHRSPQATTFPSPPGRPYVVGGDITNTSLRLAWRSNANSGASPLIGYMVEYFGHETPGQGWVVAGDMIQEPSFVVRGLQPGSGYVFTVRSRNSHGLGAPSQPSQPVATRGDRISVFKLPTQSSTASTGPVATERLSGVVVSSLKAEAVTSTTLRLSWQLLEHGGGSQRHLVEGFRISYRSVDDVTADTVDYLAKVVRPGDVKETMLTGLEPFTWYDIYLQPFHRSLEGASSAVVRSRTLEDVPSLPPQSVRATMVDNTTLALSWKPPAKRGLNGLLLGYMIYVYDNLTRLNQHIEVNSTVESLVVYHLVKGVSYTVQVSAFNKRGEGVRSDPLVAAEAVLSSAVKRDVTAEPWFLVVLVGVAVGLVSVVSCIVIIVLYQRRLARKKSSKQTIVSVPVYKFKEFPRSDLPYKDNVNRTPDVTSGIPSHFSHAYPPTSGVNQSQMSPRCYSNDTRASDGESRSSGGQGNGSRGNNLGHYYYTLQDPTTQELTDGEEQEMCYGDQSGSGTPALVRPIPQSYMIQPQTADVQRLPPGNDLGIGAQTDDDIYENRRQGSLPRRPVLFLPPPPIHAPYDDQPRDNDDSPATYRGLNIQPVNNSHHPHSLNIHSFQPAVKWSPISPTTYDDASEIEDSSAAMWNGDADESSCNALATDYEDGTSSCGSLEDFNVNNISNNRYTGRHQPADVSSHPLHRHTIDASRPAVSATSGPGRSRGAATMLNKVDV